MAQLFLRRKQNACARHSHKSRKAEKGKTGNSTVQKGTTSLCVCQYRDLVNTQVCKTITTEKTCPWGKKRQLLGEVTRQRLLLLGSIFKKKNCHSSSSPLRALEGQCQSQISQMCLLNPCSIISKDLFPAYVVSHAGTIKHNSIHLSMTNSHASTSPPTYSSIRDPGVGSREWFTFMNSYQYILTFWYILNLV